MLAMPSSGTESKGRHAEPPMISFIGPNQSSHIKAIDACGVEMASFLVDSSSKSSFTITRQLSDAASIVICTGGKSSLSSTTSMTVHGQEAQSKYNTHLGLPMGKFKWRYDSSMSEKRKELVDANQQIVAHANIDEMRFDVFVSADEMFLDCLLAGWVAFVCRKKVNGKESKAVITGFNIIGALAGGGGA